MLTDRDASVIAGSRVIRFDGIGHNLHWGCPTELAALIRTSAES